MAGYIVAVSGGEIGRPGYPIETEYIDAYTVSLSRKKNPKLLFIPTASQDSLGYVKVIRDYFGTKFGCQIDTLLLLNNPSKTEIKDKILNADIIYVGGGDTYFMLEVWNKFNIVDYLKEAFTKGGILSGVSAGAVCWFKYGLSDSFPIKNIASSFTQFEGLGLVDLLFVPHFDVEPERKNALEILLKKKPYPSIALDNCTAAVITTKNIKFIRSKDSAKVEVFIKKNNYLAQEAEYGVAKKLSEFSE